MTQPKGLYWINELLSLGEGGLQAQPDPGAQPVPPKLGSSHFTKLDFSYVSFLLRKTISLSLLHLSSAYLELRESPTDLWSDCLTCRF